MRTEAGNFKSPSPIVFESNVRWYLLAERSEVVIYKDTEHEKFKFVERLTDPNGRLKEGELDSDGPGSGFSSAGGGIRHSLDRSFHHHEEEAKIFAKKVAQSITDAVRGGRVDELVIAAEPHFLGLLRAALPTSIRSIVRHELNREYKYGSEQELRAQILQAIDKVS